MVGDAGRRRPGKEEQELTEKAQWPEGSPGFHCSGSSERHFPSPSDAGPAFPAAGSSHALKSESGRSGFL